MNVSNSKDKMDVRVTRQWRGNADDKQWVICEMRRSRRWVPSFEDLYRINQAICYCEDIKYPNGSGRNMVTSFLVDSTRINSFTVLREKYRIPNRD